MKLTVFLLFWTTVIFAQEIDSTSTVYLSRSNLDSIAVMLFEQYNFDSQKIDSLYSDQIRRDTVVVEYEHDSTQVTYHYVFFDSMFVRLFPLPFEDSRFIDAIGLAGNENFKLFGFDRETKIDQYDYYDSEDSYIMGGHDESRSILCIQRLKIKDFPYRAEFEFHIADQRLGFVVIGYSNMSEWFDHNKN